MPELEEQLRRLGAAIDFPSTPSLTRAVVDRIGAEPTRRRQGLPLRRIALALAAVLVAVAAALLVSPQARTTVLGWLGIKGVVIQRVSTLPSPTPGPSELAQRLDLGQEVSLAEAAGRVGYQIEVPQSLGNPDRVFFREPPAGGEISLVYAPRADLPLTKETSVGLLLMEFRATIDVEFFKKFVGSDTSVEVVDVNGSPGYWISGHPHGFAYRDPNQRGLEEDFRLAGNTLLWEQGGLTLRIESTLSREQALAIARTVR